MEGVSKKGILTEEDLVIVRVLINKLTRQGNFCEVSYY